MLFHATIHFWTFASARFFHKHIDDCETFCAVGIRGAGREHIVRGIFETAVLHAGRAVVVEKYPVDMARCGGGAVGVEQCERLLFDRLCMITAFLMFHCSSKELLKYVQTGKIFTRPDYSHMNKNVQGYIKTYLS
jgi:hypothetical protein